MLYNLNWLQPGKPFPPKAEAERIKRYHDNKIIFDNDCWALKDDVYNEAVKRIQRVIGNFDSYICFPVLLNYQKLISLKTADLVAGEYPTITATTDEQNKTLNEIRYDTDFDNNLYATILDLSIYGDAIWRQFKVKGEDKYTYCNWVPSEWFPIVSTDGTYTEEKQCLAWPVCTDVENGIWELHVQVHEKGFYTFYKYHLSRYAVPTGETEIDYDSVDTIGELIEKPVKVLTGLKDNAVIHLKPYKVTGTVYGVDDYTSVNSLIIELMTRIAQISNILDKHADPSITGPASMLDTNPETGELYFKKGKYYAVNSGEEKPEYLTWNGQLDSAFKQCEFLVNHLYILSEMGSALLGANDGGSQAVSGNALRLKMVNPLAKVRRISNNLSKPVTQLFANLSNKGYDEVLSRQEISISWKDGLPDDPREQVELIKLLTGESKIMPLQKAIEQYLNVAHDEAAKWIELLSAVPEESEEEDLSSPSLNDPSNSSGPGSKTGVNPRKKGSKLEPHQTGTNNNKSSRD